MIHVMHLVVMHILVTRESWVQPKKGSRVPYSVDIHTYLVGVLFRLHQRFMCMHTLGTAFTLGRDGGRIRSAYPQDGNGVWILVRSMYIELLSCLHETASSVTCKEGASLATCGDEKRDRSPGLRRIKERRARIRVIRVGLNEH